ncbi:TRAP transporter fused permease subunit [Ponticoccus sp. SC2-23]|uniref:TRAP transporter permease n=1 Tax=Alexandriicola marinus TaxID=2081710 RepID=UPI000FD8A229|nr:TRAP transporter fused permease subunit [Alexandriicola marinus]MBM1218718.1 TRAP transporter fused permease subunit [Ponticoccus sp. SC6-9]MBM1224210.1 TRAP transporter fused permease subunit [Ponticoccus sp. SC6-15]MBM1230011.1 TRAP transporter fused permease subunit [Ponticoccus sp. SC6-38]MBM1233176.1 TRAP transporter fused permease subunit [Ponticoccus sp. SC6-45]MBM1236874.1 TRAP transporter fused permease subunit [Ponticoccus sp. SC6-49]MBM1242187.1 TRAP transporter fused permease s
MVQESTQAEDAVIAEGVDEEPIEGNRRLLDGWRLTSVAAFAALYALFHMAALNGVSISDYTGINVPLLPQFPMETWNFRIVHIAGALALGFLVYNALVYSDETAPPGTPGPWDKIAWVLLVPALFALGTSVWFARTVASGTLPEMGGLTTWPAFPGTPIYSQEVWYFGVPLLVASLGGIVLGWLEQAPRNRFRASDILLAVCAIAVAAYLIPIYSTAARNSVGTPFVPIGIAFAATAGTALIMELTRRVAGMALVVITGVFLAYVFTAHLMPGILAVSSAYSWQRFFGHVYSDAGILGPTTAVSSTYIILFIIFAAFLQASKVGDYFVNFAFAAAGRARGGPAKVAIFASGLMGMINGTSAGNVVATGSLTIPLMKKVGYKPRVSGAIEAAASTGGQIMPPIMGAGAFIMAEITGIPYQEIAIAAIIPAVLYFVSVYFMVDFEAARLGMRGMREDELPKLGKMLQQLYLFFPIIILIVALFMGYSVIRAGTLATMAAAVVSWMPVLMVRIFPNSVPVGSVAGMGARSIAKAFELAGIMSIQIIAVCACAGIIVGVISLTGVGARFSSVLLDLAAASQLLALFFAMCISILLGMGMPTTAAYAVAASVVAPGLVQLGIPQLTAHFFVFYFAVLSAITPPVALASYAAAGISGANPMETSVASFKIGIAAFIVPFMFFYNSALLMDGTWFEVGRAGLTAVFGVFLLSGGVQGWFIGQKAAWIIRLALIVAALFMIEGGVITDLIGIGTVVGAWLVQKVFHPDPDAPIPVRGVD